MFCNSCGTELPDKVNYCSNCGCKIVENNVTDGGHDKMKDPAEGLTGHENDSTYVGKRPWFISTPTYVISWVAVLGTVSAILLGPKSPQGGMALCFWTGCITAIIMKRKSKSGLLWFFVGFVPVGFSLYFILVFLKTILSHY